MENRTCGFRTHMAWFWTLWARLSGGAVSPQPEEKGNAESAWVVHVYSDADRANSSSAVKCFRAQAPAVAFADALSGRQLSEDLVDDDNEYVCLAPGAFYDKRVVVHEGSEADDVRRRGRLLCGLTYARIAVSRVELV